MRRDLTVTGTVLIDAGIDKVWNGLTQPEIIREYLFGTETLTDWKVGSGIIFQGEFQGQKYRDKGIVREFLPYEKISYLYWSAFSGTEDKPENYSLVTYLLEKSGESKTKLTWIMEGFANEKAYEHSSSGMQSFLNSVKDVIENS
jgi:uncharacterized protein YndB with AHSA1/START domain